MTLTMKDLQRERDQWQQAVADSRTTIKWLEQRGDAKTKRIRELESIVKELGGKP